jgi:Fe-S-cluster containining protein
MENKDEKQEFLEKMKEMVGAEHIEYIDLDDTFGFKCQQCGKCCMNREDIILNPFDIYNGARYLGITCEEFIKQYTRMDLGGNSKIPMLLLRTTENGFCPLLKFDVKDGAKFKCSIHPAKPGACSNHPIGIMRSRKKDSDEQEELSFVKVDQCPNSVSDEQQLVRDWVKPYLDHAEEISYAHTMQTMVVDYFDPAKFWRFIQNIVMLLKERDNELYEKFLDLPKTYFGTIIGYAYTNYDINRPFVEQAKENIKHLDDFFVHTKTLYESLDQLHQEADILQAFQKIFKED